MIFALLFLGIVLSLLATDAGSRLMAHAAMVGAVLALATGLFSSQLSPPIVAACALLLFAVLVSLRLQALRTMAFAVAQRSGFVTLQTGVTLLGAAVALALGVHWIDGDAVFRVVAGDVISARFPAPLTINGSFAKGFAGLALLLMLGALSGFQRAAAKARGWWQVPLLVVFVLGVAIVLFALPLDPKLPDAWWRFVLSNVLITCVAEEAFFRGILFKYLTDAASRIVPRFTGAIVILLTSLLFAVVHSGPVEYLVMVFIVGCASGWARHVTGSVAAAIATHGAINIGHFLLLKYPF